ncbi:hypothetical protein EVA_06327, partial [gut metagenome]
STLQYAAAQFIGFEENVPDNFQSSQKKQFKHFSTVL